MTEAALDIIPTAASPRFLEADLIQWFVANVLKTGGAPNFTDGYSGTDVSGAIPLFPVVMQDTPNDCAAIACKIGASEPGYPVVKQVDVTMLIRASADEANGMSAQFRANTFASVIRNWIRPEGRNRVNVTLPSGRFVLGFINSTRATIGQDMANRFKVQVTFQMRLRGEDPL